jgi:hypothetical protein
VQIDGFLNMAASSKFLAKRVMVDNLAHGSERSTGSQEEMSKLVEDEAIPRSLEQQGLHCNLNTFTEVESLYWHVLISSLMLAHQGTICWTAQIGSHCQHEVHFVQASIMQTRIGLSNQVEIGD